LDWRDPDMPAIRDYLIEDDWGRIVEIGTEEVPPAIVTQVARQDMREASNPTHRFDSSYYWGEEARRRKAERLKRYGRS
jgi:hypothetical protein